MRFYNKLNNIHYFKILVIYIVLLLLGCNNKVKNVEEKLKINNINIVLENSASMKGYFNGNEFKSTVTNLAALFDNLRETKNKYIISNINYHIFNDKLKLKIFSSNSYDFCNKINNGLIEYCNTTPIDDFLKYIIDSTKNDDIYILVSDFVIDKVQENEIPTLQSKFNVIFNQAVKKNITLTVYRFMTDFSGTYYPSKGTPKIIQNVKRPYYIWIIGPNKLVTKITNEIDNNNLITPNNQFTFGINFSNIEQEPLHLSNYIGSFRTEKENNKVFKNIKADKNNIFQFTIGFNLSNLPKYYHNCNFLDSSIQISCLQNQVLSKKFYTKDDFNKYLSKNEVSIAKNFTHFLTIKMKGKFDKYDELNITFNNYLPKWIDVYSTDYDGYYDNITLSKTFAISHILKGIQQAYLYKSSFSYNYKFNK